MKMADDTISRQAAIDEFYMATCDVDKVEWAETVLKRVPSAERKGHWEKIHWKAFRCSECRHINESYTTYCPNCGVRNGE